MARFAPGDKVRLRSPKGVQGMIERVIDHLDGTPWYDIFLGSHSESVPESVVFGMDQKLAKPQDALYAGLLADPEAFRAYVTTQKLRHPLADHLYSFRVAKIEYHPHQFRPVLKLLQATSPRLLLADEVGLGKTIEAGLILRELHERLGLRRVLIVCPAGLTGKWQRELQEKFRVAFDILRSEEFLEFLVESEDPDNWARPFHAIVSLEIVRRKAVHDQLEQSNPSFDLLIVDEAHHLRNSQTSGFRTLRVLAMLTDALLLLTATPVNLRERDLFSLLQLLRPGSFDDWDLFLQHLDVNQFVLETARLIGENRPARECLRHLRNVEDSFLAQAFLENPLYQLAIGRLDRDGSLPRREAIEVRRSLNALGTLAEIISRTRKREVRFDSIREAHNLQVQWGPEELALYNALFGMSARAANSPQGGAFLAVMLQRMAASCLPAFVAYLEEGIASGTCPIEGEVDDLDLRDEPENGNGAGAASSLASILHLARCIPQDTKLEELRHLLAEIRRRGVQKVILFSFFRRTLDYLARQLCPTCNVRVIHGGVSMEDRDPTVAAFRDDEEFAVLLMSEVGSEGQDFQFCSCLVNYDLPWNPMRVEQRIGRLDRFGQKADKILIYSFIVGQTVEERVLERLYERIGIFQRSIGDLEAILGDEMDDLRRIIFDPELSAEQKLERADRIADALIYRTREKEEVDREGISLIGLNDLLDEETQKVEVYKRYITGSELMHLLRWGVRRFYRQTTIEVEGRSEDLVQTLTVGPDLFADIQTTQPRSEMERGVFFSQVGALRVGAPLRCTTDAERAFDVARLHQIDPRHPVIQALTRRLEREDVLPWTTALCWEGKDAERGRYFFAVFRVRMVASGGDSPDGGSIEQYLRTQVVDLERMTVVSELAEPFLSRLDSRIVEDAWVPECHGAAPLARRAFEVAEAVQHQETMEEAAREQALLRSKAEVQLSSLTESFRRKQRSMQERIDAMEMDGKTRGATLNRAQLLSIEQRYRDRLRAIQANAELTPSNEVIAAGWLTVV